MGRVNVWIPDELHEAVRDALPDLNLSAALQDALRSTLTCGHDQLVCGRCSAPVSRVDVVDSALTRFYADVQAIVAAAAREGRTAEGVARRVKDLGARYRLRIATEVPLAGLTRAEREAAKVKDLPTPTPPPASPRALSAVDDVTEAG